MMTLAAEIDSLSITRGQSYMSLQKRSVENREAVVNNGTPNLKVVGAKSTQCAAEGLF